MSDNLWKIVGKANGIVPVFYSGEPEYVSQPIPGDVIELSNEEWAIVYERNGELSYLTESEIQRMDLDSVSYRSQ